MNPDEKTIIVMNHRTRVDWNYVWIALYHATQDPSRTEVCICKEIPSAKENNDILDVISGGRSKIKFVLKDELKVVPGMGKKEFPSLLAKDKNIYCLPISLFILSDTRYHLSLILVFDIKP